MLLLKLFLTIYLLKGSLRLALGSDPSIIIIGSGASGIAAATKLLKNNFTNVKVLEAENRIGGRIYSVKLGDSFVDLGAQFCHGEQDNIVYSMAKDLGVLKHSNENFQFFRSNGDLIEKNMGEKILSFYKSLVANDKPKNQCENVTSVGECLPIQLNHIISKTKNQSQQKLWVQSKDWISSYLKVSDCTFDLNDLRTQISYKYCEGDNHQHWNGLGYKTILDIMMQQFPVEAHQLPMDDKIVLKKIVKRISGWKNKTKVRVSTTDGSNYDADHIIFTPSVGVLKAKYQTLFHPRLPQEKVDAIKNIGFGATLKMFLYFSKRWWKEDAYWYLIWTEEDREYLIKQKLEWLEASPLIFQAGNNPNVLISWYTGTHVPLIETLSDEEIARGQKYLMDTFFAPHFNATYPEKVLKSSWYSNPYFLGTYTYESVKGHLNGKSKFPDELAKPLLNKRKKPTVLFAGEATHPYYYSSVHGAIEAGYREAQRLIDLYTDRS